MTHASKGSSFTESIRSEACDGHKAKKHSVVAKDAALVSEEVSLQTLMDKDSLACLRNRENTDAGVLHGVLAGTEEELKRRGFL